MGDRGCVEGGKNVCATDYFLDVSARLECCGKSGGDFEEISQGQNCK
jgi:hypothetical protein